MQGNAPDRPQGRELEPVGRVETIHIADAAGEPMCAVECARALPGVGLEGDRYARGIGHYSHDRRVSRDLTLIEAEVVDDLAGAGLLLAAGETRRNVMTRGIPLNELVGVRFRIGEVECRGTRLCEPCAYLAGLVRQPVLEPLVHRRGLRADILTAGEIRVGDPITLLEQERGSAPDGSRIV